MYPTIVESVGMMIFASQISNSLKKTTKIMMMWQLLGSLPNKHVSGEQGL